MKKRIMSIFILVVLIVSMLAIPVNAASKDGLQDQKVNGQWVYMKNGKVDTGYTGLAKNKNGWYYIKNGVVDFTYTGLAKNSKGWWYVKKGKVDFSYNGYAKNSKGWWKVSKGKVDFSYTGFMKNSKGWWYVKKGNIDFKTTSVVKGTIDGKTGWYYVENNKYTTVDTKREVWISPMGGGDWKHPSTWVAKNQNGWWYLENGKVDFSYTGTGSNVNGYWHIKNGKVDFSANGWYAGQVPVGGGGGGSSNGDTYTVTTYEKEYKYIIKGNVLVEIYDAWGFAEGKDYGRTIVYDASNFKFHAKGCSLLKNVPAKNKIEITAYYGDDGFTDSARYYGNYKYKDRWSYYNREGIKRWTYCEHCLSAKEDGHGTTYYKFK